MARSLPLENRNDAIVETAPPARSWSGRNCVALEKQLATHNWVVPWCANPLVGAEALLALSGHNQPQ